MPHIPQNLPRSKERGIERSLHPFPIVHPVHAYPSLPLPVSILYIMSIKCERCLQKQSTSKNTHSTHSRSSKAERRTVTQGSSAVAAAAARGLGELDAVAGRSEGGYRTITFGDSGGVNGCGGRLGRAARPCRPRRAGRPRAGSPA